MNAIEIVNVSKTYHEGSSATRALDKVSFSVKKGEILGLLGANGAGKTTLISIFCGLLTRDSGSVKILGLDLDENINQIKSRVNVVSGFTMVSMRLTVREYLHYFVRLYSVRRKNIDNMLKKFSLSNMRNKLVMDLSSGYKQRLLLAKSLLNDPEIIFMDEPTVGLDVGMAVRIRKMISELKKRGTTIVFTSHNLDEVEQLCDRIVLISKGKIVQIGSVAQIKERIRNNKIIEVVCERVEEFVKTIRKLGEVKNADIVGGKIIIEARRVQDVDSIIKKSVNSDHIIVSIRKIEPSLEEAFLRIINGE